MNRGALFNILLGFLICLTVAIFAALKEHRLDVYFSMFTLEYFILTAILRPRRRFKDFLAATLLAIFFIIVGFRIMEVLAA